MVEGSIKWDRSRLRSLETLILVRDFYYNQIHSIWKILQELVRISGDSSHIYHEIISTYLDKLINKYEISKFLRFSVISLLRGLIENLLLALERLYGFHHSTVKVWYTCIKLTGL